MNCFRATKENPYHISIGGLVVNSEGRILIHHFTDVKLGNTTFDNLYLLLRETIEPHESIEQTLERGLMEEFGAQGEIVKYLGSIKGKLPIENVWAEKTTLYFLIQYIQHDELKRQKDSFESKSRLEWLNPTELIPLMKKQAAVDASLDESVIVERFIQSTVE